MKKNHQSRRKFVGALALGATASTFAAISNPLNPLVNLPSFDDEKIMAKGDAEAWFKKIKGEHRVVYDGSMPHDGFPIIWNWAYYLTNNETGSADSEITAMTVLRHDAIPFVLHSRIWKKYKLGEVFKINDNATQKPSLRNPYYEPREGDFPLPGIDGIKRLQERGAMFCVCNLAIKVYSGIIAGKMDMDTDKVYKEWVDGILPEIQLVPSGVWALGRAQEHGCAYIYAGG
ncbi:Tat (twin-arginine translocation) pathway signal sequence containing protein [Galbibacter sp. EGI 63066]|uniref:Tat (twin-arginine translocation) pathway signal sequence containing protein n=1 Tax=Galbibacter sp. EGI 63066 TaxID=2993559 RepID=UPI002248DF64|nr:Tat (twin-arginine translocation) pathway signal sequence containing protein [Galbibacter sp. EGI 63066]MCX2679270.1 Tat (twin-arginine translocation) pathway signal sequence containing protein [Galbibacter sp. EGI 63066]